MRPIALSFAIACTALAAACGGSGGSNPTPTPTPTPAPVAPSAIYTSTNDTAGNMVLVYERGIDGSLSTNKPKSYATGGAGSGASLGDQGALAFDSTWTKLFVVNAGDDSVSMLAVEDDGSLTLLANVPSGGTRPISVTVSGDLLYVLNAGDVANAGGISGFRIGASSLTAIAGSTQPLSTASAAGPAQISFAPGTNVLVVTEKATNSIDTYVVAADGSASAPDVQASAGNVPYGFAFSGDGHLLVTEAMTAAVSSYSIGADGTLTVVTPSSSTGGQNAPCWMSAAGAYGWSANAASNTVTSYAVAADGTLTNLGSIAAGNKPLDQAISPDGKYLYVLDGQDHGISVFGINGNGTLSGQLELSGLPVTAAGLITR